MDEQDFSFLIAQYKGLSKEITFAKKMQLLVANGAFILYGIIFKYFDKLPGAIFVTFFIWIGSLLYLISSHCSLQNNFLRIETVLEKFQLHAEIEDIIKQNKYRSLSSCIPYLYYAIVTVGFSVTITKLLMETIMNAKTLSTIGLSIDIIGVFFLFVYADRTVGAVTNADRDFIASKWWPRIGYILIALGFLIQIMGNFFQ